MESFDKAGLFRKKIHLRLKEAIFVGKSPHLSKKSPHLSKQSMFKTETAARPFIYPSKKVHLWPEHFWKRSTFFPQKSGFFFFKFSQKVHLFLSKGEPFSKILVEPREHMHHLSERSQNKCIKNENLKRCHFLEFFKHPYWELSQRWTFFVCHKGVYSSSRGKYKWPTYFFYVNSYLSNSFPNLIKWTQLTCTC